MRQSAVSGGKGGIRTHGELAPTAVFKTAALNHSATLPGAGYLYGRPDRRVNFGDPGAPDRHTKALSPVM